MFFVFQYIEFKLTHSKCNFRISLHQRVIINIFYVSNNVGEGLHVNSWRHLDDLVTMTERHLLVTIDVTRKITLNFLYLIIFSTNNLIKNKNNDIMNTSFVRCGLETNNCCAIFKFLTTLCFAVLLENRVLHIC